VYLLQKVARGDFHYWMPLNGVFGLVVSLLVRVSVKTLADFTGVIHFRHPIELGGLYWTVNVFMALLASVASVWVYYEKGSGLAMEQSTAWTLVGLLGGLWTASFGVFLVLMKKEFRSTFFSTELGKVRVMNSFLKSKDDATKALVLDDNKLLWVSIRPQVKEWVLERWPVWQTEKPEFFSEQFIAAVPLDMIPTRGQDEAKKARRSVRKRSLFNVNVLPVLNMAVAEDVNGEVTAGETNAAERSVKAVDEVRVGVVAVHR